MNKTKIEWVKNPDGSQGYTWNPITGCLNHDKGLCKGGGFPCYAYKLANGRLRSRYLSDKNIAPVPTPITMQEVAEHLKDPFYPRFWPERLLGSFCHDVIVGQEKGIFVCNMGELFGDWIPAEWQNRIFEVIRAFPEHRFYLLTKQPQNLAQWSPLPENAWVGVTATGYDAFNKALDYLKPIEAKVKFISVEPLLEAIPFYMERLVYCGINWLIIGSQTKPTVMPKIEWVQEIVEACDKAGIPVFLKNNLEKLTFDYKWPEIEKHWSLFDRIDHVDDFILGATMRQETPT